MTKIISVTGATGQQGGSVVRIMLKNPDWTVRAVTRNPDGEASKALAAQGAQVVQASFDDETSLQKAFQGAHAIFAVTNFWEHLFTGKNHDESGQAEEAQGMALAKAASKSSTLEHYIWSTLPGAASQTNNKTKVAHLDYKSRVDDRIRSELPDLAKKTTFLYFGYYPSNMAYFPMCKPFEMPNSYGKYVQMMPTKPTATIPVSGDITINPGVWVRSILANPQKTFGKYANVSTDILSFEELMQIWSSVTNRQGVFVECSLTDYEKIWGPGGKELGDQLKYGEEITDWTEFVRNRYGFITKEELGITDAVGTKEALEAMRQVL